MLGKGQLLYAITGGRRTIDGLRLVCFGRHYEDNNDFIAGVFGITIFPRVVILGFHLLDEDNLHASIL